MSCGEHIQNQNVSVSVFRAAWCLSFHIQDITALAPILVYAMKMAAFSQELDRK
jgi:hypothetical protein